MAVDSLLLGAAAVVLIPVRVCLLVPPGTGTGGRAVDILGGLT